MPSTFSILPRLANFILRRLFKWFRKAAKLPLFWLRRPEKQHRLLRRIVDRVRNSLELKVVLQSAVDEVATLLELDHCIFFWYFHDTKRVQVICESTRSSPEDESVGETVAHHTLQMGYYPLDMFGAAAESIARGELIISSGSITHSPILRQFNRLMGVLRGEISSSGFPVMGAIANLLVPVKPQEMSIGFIACLSSQPRRWTVADVEFLRLLARQLEVAIGQARLYEQMLQQAQRERLVNQITAQTRQSFDLEKILNGAIVQLLEALQVDRCLVHLVENASETLNTPSSGSISGGSAAATASALKCLYEVCRPPFPATIDYFDPNGPMTRWVMANNRRVVITDVSQDERIGTDNPEYQQAQIKSSLVIPVQTKENLYAILYLNQCSYIRYWAKNDQKLAQAVADQLAISIQQAYLYAQTQQQAVESAAQAKHLAETLDELRLAQAQLIQSEKMSSLGRMVAGVAHEINNPVNFIYGNVPYVESYFQDLLQTLNAYQTHVPQPNAELQRLVNEVDLDFLLTDLPRILGSMRSGADRIRQIVLSLRNFSRLDEAQCKTVDIHEGLESTLSVLQPYWGEEIQIIRKYGDLPLVECYPGDLNQAFMNILMNAVDALKGWQSVDKAIALRTERLPTSENRPERIRIAITDNGPGIPPEAQSKIFDPFFTTKTVGQGTGLGLTVSYQVVVNQHGGWLTFRSEPGLGTEFMIELPIQSTN